MDNLSKDIILKICGTMVMKDVLTMRCLTKRYDRIFSNYVNKNFYLNFKELVIWIADCYKKSIFSDENDTNIIIKIMKKLRDGIFLADCYKKSILSDENDTDIIIKIIKKLTDRIFLAENFYIDMHVNDMEHICKSFKHVKNIIIHKKQWNYDFLSLFQSLESIEINFELHENAKNDLEIFPVLENMRCLTIRVLKQNSSLALKISDMLKKMPNIEKLICNYIALDVERLPKIKYLEITYSYDIYYYDQIVMEDLEEIILYFTHSRNMLTIPRVKKITINEMNMYNSIHCLSLINFDNNRIESLAIRNNSYRAAFMRLYGSLEFKSLKKIELGNKYALLNNKIILIN